MFSDVELYPGNGWEDPASNPDPPATAANIFVDKQPNNRRSSCRPSGDQDEKGDGVLCSFSWWLVWPKTPQTRANLAILEVTTFPHPSFPSLFFLDLTSGYAQCIAICFSCFHPLVPLSQSKSWVHLKFWWGFFEDFCCHFHCWWFGRLSEQQWSKSALQTNSKPVKRLAGSAADLPLRLAQVLWECEWSSYFLLMLFPQFYVFFPNYPNLHKLTLSIFLHTIDLSLVWYKVTVYKGRSPIKKCLLSGIGPISSPPSPLPPIRATWSSFFGCKKQCVACITKIVLL